LLIFLAVSAFSHPNDAASDLVIVPHVALRKYHISELSMVQNILKMVTIQRTKTASESCGSCKFQLSSFCVTVHGLIGAKYLITQETS
jgi:hypothetical protein